MVHFRFWFLPVRVGFTTGMGRDIVVDGDSVTREEIIGSNGHVVVVRR